MSEQSINTRSNQIRNETQEYANTRGRVADVINDINETKANKTDVAQSFIDQNQNLQSHINNHNNPHVVTKNQIGLNFVDNTSDLDKPISTATQNALNNLSTTITTSFDDKINKKADGLENASGIGFVGGTVDATPYFFHKTGGYVFIATQSWTNSNFISNSQKGVANGVATLDGGGKIPVSQLPNSVMELQGNWDASTNTPTLSDGNGNPGDVYEVKVAGTQNLGSGNIIFKVGDWAVYGADGKWYVSLNSNEVTSVNGLTGAVVLDKSHVGLGNVDNTADINKNVLSASKWTTARTFTIGNVSKSVDGTGDTTWTTSEIISGLNLVTTSDLLAYVPKAGDTNIQGIKRFTGIYTEWSLNNDTSNAIGFMQSYATGFFTGTSNDKDYNILRNSEIKINVGSSLTTVKSDLYIQGTVVSNYYNSNILAGNSVISTSPSEIYFGNGNVSSIYHQVGNSHYFLVGGGLIASINPDGISMASGGFLYKNGDIEHKQTTTGINATGSIWRNKDGSGNRISGIGAFTNNGDFIHNYIGWGVSPWSTGSCLAVSDSLLTYKGFDIYHAGNFAPVDFVPIGGTIPGNPLVGLIEVDTSGDSVGFKSIDGDHERGILMTDDGGNSIYSMNTATQDISYMEAYVGYAKIYSEKSSSGDIAQIQVESGLIETTGDLFGTDYIIPKNGNYYIQKNYLDNSLGNYVPYTGADKPIDIGSQNLSTTGSIYAGGVTANNFIGNYLGSDSLDGGDILSVAAHDVLAFGNTTLSNIYYSVASNHVFISGGSVVATINPNGISITGTLRINGDTAATQGWVNTALSVKAQSLENAYGIGFANGELPSNDGTKFPYFYYDNGITQSIISLATQGWVNATFVKFSDLDGYVSSVNGQTGAVNLTTSNVQEGSNLYFTNARVKSYADTLYSQIGHTHTWSEITGKPNFSAVASSGDYNDLINKPALNFAPAVHTHVVSDVTGLQSALDAKENAFSKNTAFNKNFGTSSGTVAQGNDSRIINGDNAFSWGNHADQGYLKNGNDFTTDSLYREIDSQIELNDTSIKEYHIVFDSSTDTKVTINAMVDGQSFRISNFSSANTVELWVNGYPAALDTIGSGDTKLYLSHHNGKLRRLSANPTGPII